tara:strand:+ start:509 stop:766 length:258 start_codon:yes stop_codon:yes gene_type:complete
VKIFKSRLTLTALFGRLERAVLEDMSDLDPDQGYDTRVKLADWQLHRLRKRKRLTEHGNREQSKSRSIPRLEAGKASKGVVVDVP